MHMASVRGRGAAWRGGVEAGGSPGSGPKTLGVPQAQAQAPYRFLSDNRTRWCGAIWIPRGLATTEVWRELPMDIP